MTASAEAVRLCGKCGAVPPGGATSCVECGAAIVVVAPPHDAMLGMVLDQRFEIRAVLGQGGMGTVYRAYQRSTDREVAIKVIDARRMRDVGAIRRFLREAKLASQLAHPNTVSVFDFGQSADGYLYLVMELVQGRTLWDVLRAEGPMAMARAVRIAIQLCDALEVAHARSIVHRDLKLANVMVLDDPPGRDLVKVLDFGIAKSPGTGTEITEQGALVGTPRYMTPQALAGHPARPDWDLYAVGVMLIELTSGLSPFRDENLTELVHQKLVSPTIPSAVPPPLVPIIEALLAPDPEQRIGSAAELRRRLSALTGAPEVAVRPLETSTTTVLPSSEVSVVIVPTEAPPRRRSRAPLAAGLVVVAAAAGLAVWMIGRRAPTRAPAAARDGSAAPAAPGALAAPDAAPAAAVEVAAPVPVPAGPVPASAGSPDVVGAGASGAPEGGLPPDPPERRDGHHHRSKPGKPTHAERAGSASATTPPAEPPPPPPPVDRCKRSPRPADCPPF